MKTEDKLKQLNKAREVIADLKITELTDKDIVESLTKLRISLGDLFKIYRIR